MLTLNLITYKILVCKYPKTKNKLFSQQLHILLGNYGAAKDEMDDPLSFFIFVFLIDLV